MPKHSCGRLVEPPAYPVTRALLCIGRHFELLDRWSFRRWMDKQSARPHSAENIAATFENMSKEVEPRAAGESLAEPLEGGLDKKNDRSYRSIR
jgi:hypothetical protein